MCLRSPNLKEEKKYLSEIFRVIGEMDNTGGELSRGQEDVDLYMHSPIRLHGVVLN
jgi:hypothetical protein